MPQENLGFVQFEEGLGVRAMMVSPATDEKIRVDVALGLYLLRENRGLLKREDSKEEKARNKGAEDHLGKGPGKGEQNGRNGKGRDYYTGN